MPRSPQRVLLYRLGSLGDHLVALPCYRLVARAFPEADRRLLTNIPISAKAAAAEAVLGGSGLVRGFLTYVVGERKPLALLQLWWQVVRFRPDVLVYLAGARGLKAARRDAAFFRLCGVRRIIGLPDSEDLQRNRSLGLRGNIPWHEEEAARLARCLAALGDAHLEDQENWRPGLTEEERARAAELLAQLKGRPFVTLSIGTKVQSNHWGLENWIKLLERLAVELPGHALVVLGAQDEALASEPLAAAWAAAGDFSSQGLNLCGACSPRVSAAVMEQATLFLGHDSGPAHMAASVGTPVLGIYSSRMQPGEWTPHGEHVRVLMHWVECGGCLLETCIEQRKKCILSIGPEEALAATLEHLQAMHAAGIRRLPRPQATQLHFTQPQESE